MDFHFTLGHEADKCLRLAGFAVAQGRVVLRTVRLIDARVGLMNLCLQERLGLVRRYVRTSRIRDILQSVPLTALPTYLFLSLPSQ